MINGCIACGQAQALRRNEQKERNQAEAIEYAKSKNLKRIVITQTPRGIYRFKEENEPLKEGFTIFEYLFAN